jgi:hypothetical protein
MSDDSTKILKLENKCKQQENKSALQIQELVAKCNTLQQRIEQLVAEGVTSLTLEQLEALVARKRSEMAVEGISSSKVGTEQTGQTSPGMAEPPTLGEGCQEHSVLSQGGGSSMRDAAVEDFREAKRPRTDAS